MKRIYTLALLVSSLFFNLKAQINTDNMLNIGRNALYFEDYVLSIQYFNQVIKAKPYLAEPYFFRAVAKLYLEDNAGADDDCTRALEKNNFLVKAYICRSYARMRLSNFEGAISDCNRGLEFDSQNKTLLYNKGFSLVYAKKFEEAESTLEEMIRRFPKDIDAYLAMGKMNVERGDTLKAIEDFSRSVAVDKFNALGWGSRGWIFLMKENYANALADLNEAIRLTPENSIYYMNRAMARYNLNDLRGTMEDFDKCISLDPNSKLSYLNRAILRTTVGDLNKALEDYDKVLYLDPNDFQVVYNRALVRKDLGKYRDAISDFSTILDKYPTFTPALYQRSESKRLLGDAKGADKDYFAAWSIDEKAKAKKLNKPKDKSTENKDSTEQTFDFSKFKRMIAGETKESNPDEYKNPMRGKVQNRNTEIELEPLFRLTYYEKLQPGPSKRMIDLSRYIGSLTLGGKKDGMKPILSNDEQSLTSEQAASHFASIDDLSKIIENNPNNASYVFGRGLDFAIVQDLTNALTDMNKAIELDSKYLLAYFERANLRYRKMSVDYAEKDNLSNAKATTSSGNQTSIIKSNFDSPTVSTGVYSVGEKAYGADLELVIKDLDKVLTIDPTFYFAYYNRGVIRCLIRDYRNALIDFTKAIESNSDFADAWFNRGITQIYLGDREHGMIDLRMAGQLGNYKAYSILKSLGE